MANPPPVPLRDLAFVVQCLADARREPYPKVEHHGGPGLTAAQHALAVEVLDLALQELRARLAPAEEG